MRARLRELTERLLARSGRGAKYGLERMRQALETVAHPESNLPVVHVAGTNGKGSVCAMVEAIARSAGLRVGMFTSPHLCQLNERIRLDGQPIDDERFADALECALGATPEVTFFEAMTIAGFSAMRDARVDLAIFEVGLGGRLDATNVLPPPLCAVITSIGRDHTRLLGEALPDIAREKAGIIKIGSPLVIGAMDPAARDAIICQARTMKSGPVTVVTETEDDAASLRDRDLRVVVVGSDGDGIDLRGAVHAQVATPGLHGFHQHLNAAAAAAAITQLVQTHAISRKAIETGLASTRWPGRLERMQRGGVSIVLDCAHNLPAARALDAALGDLAPARTHLVFGALGDKQWRDMLQLLGPRAEHRHYCTPIAELAGRMPAPLEEVAAMMPGVLHPSRAHAIDAAIAGATAGDTIIVTGSIFLVGSVRAHLTGDTSDPAIPL